MSTPFLMFYFPTFRVMYPSLFHSMMAFPVWGILCSRNNLTPYRLTAPTRSITTWKISSPFSTKQLNYIFLKTKQQWLIFWIRYFCRFLQMPLQPLRAWINISPSRGAPNTFTKLSTKSKPSPSAPVSRLTHTSTPTTPLPPEGHCIFFTNGQQSRPPSSGFGNV